MKVKSPAHDQPFRPDFADFNALEREPFLNYS